MDCSPPNPLSVYTRNDFTNLKKKIQWEGRQYIHSPLVEHLRVDVEHFHAVPSQRSLSMNKVIIICHHHGLNITAIIMAIDIVIVIIIFTIIFIIIVWSTPDEL